MSAKPVLSTPFSHLPGIIPIFPLPAAVLLPNVQLPLNIFEPRYLNMTLDALGAQRLIGMIQPQQANTDDIYSIGCAGRITAFNETHDERLLIVLTGVCRFKVQKELESTRGYRRVKADWRAFAGDFDMEDTHMDIDVTKDLVRAYAKGQKLDMDWAQLEKLPENMLINILCCQLPFPAEDKQALVEAIEIGERLRLLNALCRLHQSSSVPPVNTTH